MSRAQTRLATLRKEYDAKFVELRKAVARIRYWQEQIRLVEAEVRRARKKTRARLREAQDRLAETRANITPHLARREDIIADINYERDVLLRPLLSRIETLRRNIREIEEELEARKRTVTVRSEPISVAFRYDDVETTTPVTFTVYRDETVSFYMPDVAFDEEGNEYRFAKWENGSTDPTRTIRVVEDVTVTVIYEPVVPPEYEIWEFCKYYKYDRGPAFRRRKFEVRGSFTLPADVVKAPKEWVNIPSSIKDTVEDLFDEAMRDVGSTRTRIDQKTGEVVKEVYAESVIDPADFVHEWCEVGAEYIDITDTFESSVEVTVEDKIKGRERVWKVTVTVTEKELSV